MGKSQQTFGKKEREKKRIKKRQDKLAKKEARKADNKKSASFEEMLSYVDENGQLTDTPPDPTKKKKEVDASTIEIGVPKREKVDPNAPREGKVAFFNDEKGYGFITETGTEEKFFAHVSGLIDEVKENDKVTFLLERGPKGMNAVQVRLVTE